MKKQTNPIVTRDIAAQIDAEAEALRPGAVMTLDPAPPEVDAPAAVDAPVTVDAPAASGTATPFERTAALAVAVADLAEAANVTVHCTHNPGGKHYVNVSERASGAGCDAAAVTAALAEIHRLSAPAPQ